MNPTNILTKPKQLTHSKKTSLVYTVYELELIPARQQLLGIIKIPPMLHVKCGVENNEEGSIKGVPIPYVILNVGGVDFYFMNDNLSFLTRIYPGEKIGTVSYESLEDYPPKQIKKLEELLYAGEFTLRLSEND